MHFESKSARRSRERREREEAAELARQEEYRREAELKEEKDACSLEYLIDQASNLEDIKYVLHRMHRAQQLQLELLKRNLK